MGNLKFKVNRIFEIDEKLARQITWLMDEGTNWDSEQGKLFLKDKSNALFVAFVEDVAVGYLSAHRLQRFDSKKAEVLIYEVSVDESFRQNGIGKALIESVKVWAKKMSADNAWVLTYSSNLPAMALYKSAGGEEDEPGTRMFTYKV